MFFKLKNFKLKRTQGILEEQNCFHEKLKGMTIATIESLRFPQRERQRECHNSFLSFLPKN